ncbi:MAG: hypothetical protein AAGF15_06890 [Pseudomonadota bacterium]
MVDKKLEALAVMAHHYAHGELTIEDYRSQRDQLLDVLEDEFAADNDTLISKRSRRRARANSSRLRVPVFLVCVLAAGAALSWYFLMR